MAPNTRDVMTVERIVAKYERLKQKKRVHMARRYTADAEFRARKCADAMRRYHERVPTARYNKPRGSAEGSIIDQGVESPLPASRSV